MEPIVLVERKGKVGVLTMNAPDKLNCLGDDMLSGIYDGLRELEADDGIRAIILRGAGRAFCAGYDLSPREKPFTTIGDWLEHAKHGNRTFFAIWDCKKPVIALVQGYAMGGGCDLAMVCDFTLAADTAVLGEPEIQFSSASSFILMPWAVGMKQARNVLLTGDRVSAARAEEIGMVTSVVAEANLEKEGMDLAKKLVKVPVPAMQLNKENINRAYETAGIREALLAGEQIFGAVHMTHTPENDAFFAVAAEKGLKEAFKWRDAQFASE
ncbi:enoyl-CoA hydratase/isomerase family protein [Ruminococcaceae bacterium OttesenSCG-928-D13]|nr:enoyl-CoA hydratase/isomerase family protein [Ruminococcaceae bacterium OttesenSCG-928-D13]